MPCRPAEVAARVLGMAFGLALAVRPAGLAETPGSTARRRQVQRVGRQLIHKQHLKTDGSTDVLPLPDICLAALRLQRQAQERMRSRLEQAGGTWPADGLVFTTRTGRPIEPRAVGRRFDLRCAKAGVRRIRVHDTRRTCGSLLAAFDVHPRVAMRILRHSKIAITMELYTMVPDEAALAALTRLSDTLSSADAALPDDAE